MTLSTLWFVFVALLFGGFFLLEGFDYGVGILLPRLGRKDQERSAILTTIGPHWDGNEVWMITAGGALFAAFPPVYAALFSAFYLPLVFLLTALIVRGVGIEYRGKIEHPSWRALWDWGIFAGSLLAAFLWGVLIGNWLRGFALQQDGHYYGGLGSLLNPYALFSGLFFTTLFVLHGAIFLARKAPEAIAMGAERIARFVWVGLLVGLVLFLAWTWAATDILTRPGLNGSIPAGLALLAFLLVGRFLRRRRSGLAFVGSALTVLLLVGMLFAGLYPRLLISTLNPAYSLTVENAASSPYALRVMTIVTLVFLPGVLAYQAWTYWIFRQRVRMPTE